MKRYVIFAALGPLIGGFLLLIATTYASGYWSQISWSKFTGLFVSFAKSLHFNYLFGILPSLMLAAVDDIICHIRTIVPVLRILIIGAIGFAAAELTYGSREPNGGAIPFVLYGLIGLVPTIISSWLSHQIEKRPKV